jgi:catechol 2,3-dioxygenase-like lactoylglutathione lyase family enzyme
LREETRHDLQGDLVTVKRMDNVGIVVEDLDDAVEFFTELGLRRKGEPWSKENGPDASRDLARNASRSP